MAVKMRLTRMGDKKSPFYRIVVVDSRVARDGMYIDKIGHYNPIVEPAEIVIDADKAKDWLAKVFSPPKPFVLCLSLRALSKRATSLLLPKPIPKRKKAEDR